MKTFPSETSVEKALTFFQLIPEQLRDRAVIAGGAAVDFDLAGDVDMWILSPRDQYIDPTYLENLATLLTNFLDLGQLSGLPAPVEFDITFVPYIPGQPEEQPAIATGIFKGVKLIDGFFGGKKFQIMHTCFAEAASLLADFDLSVHQVALLPSGAIVKVGTTTRPGEPISMVHVSDAESTAERLIKLNQRYSSQ